MGKRSGSKAKRRRPKRRKSLAASASTPDRLKARVTRRRPIAAEGEPPEDVAVFDLRVRQPLPDQLAEQAEAVAEALQLTYDAWGEQASRRVSEIPRSSPLSEWRLFHFFNGRQPTGCPTPFLEH